MTSKLPTKLEKGPLVDAGFEVLFESHLPLATVLPGYLFSMLGGSEIERMPNADIPQQLRDSEPNLQFIPLVNITIPGFRISVGDRSLQVCCLLPYPGWSSFKEKILETLNVVLCSKIAASVIRYSLKYTDILPADFIGGESKKISASVAIGGREIDLSKTNIQTQIHEGDTITLLNIAGSVTVQLTAGNEERTGVLVNIDSINAIDKLSLEEFVGVASVQLDGLHAINKKMFFDCLSGEGLEALGPSYA